MLLLIGLLLGLSAFGVVRLAYRRAPAAGVAAAVIYLALVIWWIQAHDGRGAFLIGLVFGMLAAPPLWNVAERRARARA